MKISFIEFIILFSIILAGVGCFFSINKTEISGEFSCGNRVKILNYNLTGVILDKSYYKGSMKYLVRIYSGGNTLDMFHKEEFFENELIKESNVVEK